MEPQTKPEHRFRNIAATVIVVSLLGWWAYESWIVKPEHARIRREQQRAADANRLNSWAYIAKEKQISADETVRLLVIPNSLNIDILDTKCLIYTNQAFKTSQIICPEARQTDIEETP